MSIFVWLLGMIIDHHRVIFISDEPYEIYEWYKTEFPSGKLLKTEITLRNLNKNWISSKENSKKLFFL